jgi:hypothetical protein
VAPVGFATPAATAASPAVACPCEVRLSNVRICCGCAVLDYREVVLRQVHHRTLLVADDDVHEHAGRGGAELGRCGRRLRLPRADAGRGGMIPSAASNRATR